MVKSWMVTVSSSKSSWKAEKAWTIYYFVLKGENGGTVVRSFAQDEMLRLAKLTN